MPSRYRRIVSSLRRKYGRQLGHAALSALESMGPPETDLAYAGPVVSGATLGTWARRPFDAERRAASARFAGGAFAVDLPLRPRPARAELEGQVAAWEARQRAADAAVDAIAARDAGARAERACRWLGRIADLPDGPTFAPPFRVQLTGEALWITCAGEPYSVIARELRARFPGHVVLFSPLAGEVQVAYLLPRDRYGLGLYQEEPSILAPGCLESLTEAIAARCAELVEPG